MKKSEQEFVNSCIEKYVQDLDKILEENRGSIKWKQLYYCSAEYCKIGNTYILRSYNTIIAVFDVEYKMCFDFLRFVFGYTSTSAQHYAKFKRFVILENARELNWTNYTEWRWII